MFRKYLRLGATSLGVSKAENYPQDKYFQMEPLSKFHIHIWNYKNLMNRNKKLIIYDKSISCNESNQ